jgi:hypothetical protein
MASSRRIAGLALALGALVATPSAQADWKRDYETGLRAMEEGRWADAEAAFRAALEEEPEAAARKRIQGSKHLIYVPHYFAAVAAFQQGSCERALQYWSNPSSAAVVSDRSNMSEARTRGMAECRERLATTSSPAPAVAAATPDDATDSAPTPAPAEPIAPAPTKPTTPAPTPAPIATRPAPEPTKPAPVTPAAPAPAALVSAVQGYLEGRYAVVLQLDPATLADAGARAQAHLLRAAARYTLAMLAERDTRQLEQARQEVRAARAANAGLTPDDALFSPRFRAFWRESR